VARCIGPSVTWSPKPRTRNTAFALHMKSGQGGCEPALGELPSLILKLERPQWYTDRRCSGHFGRSRKS
jgi:hypothetical protein